MNKLKKLYRELGGLDMLVYLLHRMLQLISRRLAFVSYRLVVVPCPDAPLAAKRLIKNYQIRELHPGDPQLMNISCDKDEIANRYRQDGVCFAAFKNAQLMGSSWVIQQGYLEVEDRCQMQPADNGVWDCDIYIDESDRLGFCFLALWEHQFQWMREHGYHWTASRISGINSRSLNSHLRLGGVVVGRQFFIRVGRLELYFGTLKPYVNLSKSIAGAPLISINMSNHSS